MRRVPPSIRRVVLLACLAAIAGPTVVAERPERAARALSSRSVVVVELFTSEGCSSCPPADAILSALAGAQPIPGVEVVALGEHVDYWDELGWRDPFSSPLFTERQREYDESVFRSGEIYTPQLVTDGEVQCIGSDRKAVWRALEAAASWPKASVDVEPGQVGGGGVDVTVRVEVPPVVRRRGAADLLIAVTQDRLATHVRGGENGGRTLTHNAVVRSLSAAGAIGADESRLTATSRVAIRPEWDVSALHVVAIVQERASRRILGGGSAALVSTPH
jgi:hypothetical protein